MPPYNALAFSNGCYSAIGLNEANGNTEPVFSVTQISSGKFIEIKTLQRGTLEIFSADGKIISEKKLAASNEMLDVSDLSSGIYFFRFVNSGTVSVSKVLVGW